MKAYFDKVIIVEDNDGNIDKIVHFNVGARKKVIGKFTECDMDEILEIFTDEKVADKK